MDEDAVPPREVADEGIGRAAGRGGAVRKQFGGRALGVARASQEIETFGQQHPIGSVFGHRLLDQGRGLGEIGRLVVDRVHLDERDLHGVLGVDLSHSSTTDLA